ncbi:MAG TPA: hypothetical protein DEA69_06730 [Microbacterium sp.]|nr:hypothetical protein [Microbacterium sp.]
MRAWAALTPPRRAVQEAKAAFARADVLAAGADPTPRPTALSSGAAEQVFLSRPVIGGQAAERG